MDFGVLKGKTIKEIDGLSEGSDRATFTCTDETKYVMYHTQDCCEHVSIVDVCGDADDLLNSEILLSEEESNADVPEDIKAAREAKAIEDIKRNGYGSTYVESETWTFYKISTNKGSVTIRWLGSSNGYYSESVYFEEIT